jgi:hypothetical protein
VPDAPTPSAAGSESAAELLATLRRLVREGRVTVRVDARRLNHIDSPVAFEADGNIWVYGAIVLAALALWRVGIAAAAAVLAGGIALYLTLGRAYIHRRIERRVRDKALENLEIWRKLWRFNGITLAASERPDLTPCASPEGNWMGFVRGVV